MTTAAREKAFILLAKTGDIPDRTVKDFKVGEIAILLARVGDRFYAVGNSCPHLGASLSQGKLDGTIITCPRHASRFDLADGRVLRWTDWTGIRASLSKLFRAPQPLTVYATKVEGDNILIQV